MKDKKLINTVIHTPTHEEYVAMTNLASKLGYMWADEEQFDKGDVWEVYEEDTCIDVCGGTYGDISQYVKDDYTIKSTQWFLDNFEEKEEKTNPSFTLKVTKK